MGPYKRAWNTNFVRNKREQLSDSERAAINAKRREKYRLQTEQQRKIRQDKQQASALMQLLERNGSIKKRLKRSQEKSDKEAAKKEIAEAADAMTAIKGSQLDSQSSQSSQLPSRYPKRVTRKPPIYNYDPKVTYGFDKDIGIYAVAQNDIQAGIIIGEYGGDRIDYAEKERRIAEYNSNDLTHALQGTYYYSGHCAQSKRGTQPQPKQDKLRAPAD